MSDITPQITKTARTMASWLIRSERLSATYSRSKATCADSTNLFVSLHKTKIYTLLKIVKMITEKRSSKRYSIIINIVTVSLNVSALKSYRPVKGRDDDSPNYFPSKYKMIG